MKFFNKKQLVRSNWTKVSHPNSVPWRNEMRAWCKQFDSNGRFYTYYGSENWWFEFEKDATMFVLRWS